MLRLFRCVWAPCAGMSCAPTLRVHPRRLPGRAACRGQSHHAVPRKRLHAPAVREFHRDRQEVPIPSFHFGPLSRGHPVPAAPAAHAEFHLHLPHHHPGCRAGKGEETEGNALKHLDTLVLGTVYLGGGCVPGPVSGGAAAVPVATEQFGVGWAPTLMLAYLGASLAPALVYPDFKNQTKAPYFV